MMTHLLIGMTLACSVTHAGRHGARAVCFRYMRNDLYVDAG